MWELPKWFQESASASPYVRSHFISSWLRATFTSRGVPGEYSPGTWCCMIGMDSPSLSLADLLLQSIGLRWLDPLASLGAHTFDDLTYLTEEDLHGIGMRVVDIRRLSAALSAAIQIQKRCHDGCYARPPHTASARVSATFASGVGNSRASHGKG